MPVISRFFGITVSILYRDHHPAHFHARYGDDEITVQISDGRVAGKMQRRAQALVLEWWALHREELEINWLRATSREPLLPIRPLE